MCVTRIWHILLDDIDFLLIKILNSKPFVCLLFFTCSFYAEFKFKFFSMQPEDKKHIIHGLNIYCLECT